jgi:hypothetical protein
MASASSIVHLFMKHPVSSVSTIETMRTESFPAVRTFSGDYAASVLLCTISNVAVASIVAARGARTRQLASATT